MLTFVNFGNLAVYSGLSYYGPILSPSPHLGFLLSSLVELPGYVFVQLTADRFGRRLPQIGCMLVGGIACIAAVAVPEHNVHVFMLFCLLGKLFINISYMIAELMEGMPSFPSLPQIAMKFFILMFCFSFRRAHPYGHP